MTHTPPMLSLSRASLDLFLSLLPPDRITRTPDRVTVHAEVGDAVWFASGNRWITAAPGFDRARRFGGTGKAH